MILSLTYSSFSVIPGLFARLSFVLLLFNAPILKLGMGIIDVILVSLCLSLCRLPGGSISNNLCWSLSVPLS